MPNKPTIKQMDADNRDLRTRLEKAEATLSEILCGESDALFVASKGGTQLFTLKGADQAYRTLIEDMSEGALTLTAEGVILYSNRRFAEMLRAPLERVIGSELLNWIAPEHRQILPALLRNEATDNHREELALAAADGTRVPVYISVSRLVLEETPDALCMVVTDLTQQKRTEEILAAEKLSNAIMEQAADVIVICDETGRIIRTSKQSQAFCSKNPLGQLFERAFPLRQLDGIAFSAVGAIEPNRGQLVEARLECDGQGVDLLVSVGHLKDVQGELLGSVVTLTDITEHKLAEKDLRWRTAFFEALVKTSPDGILVVGSQGNKILQNQRMIDLWKIPEDIAANPDDKSQLQHVINQVVDTEQFGDKVRFLYDHPEETSQDEVTLINGTILDRYSSPVLDGDGHSYGRIWTFHDNTKRKQEELKLLESERRFSDLLKNIELISVMLDRGARITYCNDYLLRLTGWQREEVIGKSWWDLFVPPELHDLKGDFFSALLDNQTEALHHENDIVTRSDERRHIRWNNSVLRAVTGEVIGTASIGEDITERKKSEAGVKYLNRVLSVLSGINALIVHVNDREELFREACKIAVEKGGFRMALLAIVNRIT